MKKNAKELPKGIPEENIYLSLHLSIIITIIIAVASMYILLFLE